MLKKLKNSLFYKIKFIFAQNFKEMKKILFAQKEKRIFELEEQKRINEMIAQKKKLKNCQL